MRGPNDGNCMRYCNTGPASTCASAMEMLLADVSPGGQYAEYNDTTNRDFPMGIVDPTKFPLSVLNDGNQLPVMNASWRIPAFDYQNRDGSIAYIEISADKVSHGDLGVWQWGRSFSHGGIVLPNRQILHAQAGVKVVIDNLDTHEQLKRRPVRWFTFWP